MLFSDRKVSLGCMLLALAGCGGAGPSGSDIQGNELVAESKGDGGSDTAGRLVRTDWNPDLRYLSDNMERSHKNLPVIQPKKKAIFKKAAQAFNRHSASVKMSFYRYSHPGDWHLSDSREPAYFSSKPHFHPIKVSFSKGIYSWNASAGCETFWVDFANRKLGGGFTSDHGFVQEEIMFAEIPQLASFALRTYEKHTGSQPYIRSSIETRIGHPTLGDRVLKGSPAPLVFKNVQRVAAFDTGGIYGSKFRSFDESQLDNRFRIFPQSRLVHVLAMAAPKLPGHADEKLRTDINLVRDYFNTVYSGFLAAKLATKEGVRTLIASGRLGAGAFNNDPVVALTLQVLAAELLNVDLNMHMFSEVERARSRAVLEAVRGKGSHSIKQHLTKLSQAF